MTSASELFYIRRSRLGRNTDPIGFEGGGGGGGGFESSMDRFPHNHRRHPHHQRRDRQDRDGCDTLRRSPNLRHSSLRTTHVEHESVHPDHVSSQSASGFIVNSENFRQERQSFSGNSRLPGAVILARERLLQRLRGVSLSENRRIVLDAAELSRNWQATDSISQTDQLLMLQETKKKPLGLTQEALDCLLVEVFKIEKVDEAETLRASRECSICLESFLQGDELIRLPCGHKFHSCCLYPWVRTCGDCPYCRTGIVVDNKAIKESH